MYRYLIDFVYDGGEYRVELNRDVPIRDMNDVKRIEADLARQSGESEVQVRSWSRFEDAITPLRG